MQNYYYSRFEAKTKEKPLRHSNACELWRATQIIWDEFHWKMRFSPAFTLSVRHQLRAISTVAHTENLTLENVQWITYDKKTHTRSKARRLRATLEECAVSVAQIDFWRALNAFAAVVVRSFHIVCKCTNSSDVIVSAFVQWQATSCGWMDMERFARHIFSLQRTQLSSTRHDEETVFEFAGCVPQSRAVHSNRFVLRVLRSFRYILI